MLSPETIAELAGELAGATGLSNAMKFLSGIESLSIGATPVGAKLKIGMDHPVDLGAGHLEPVHLGPVIAAQPKEAGRHRGHRP